MKILLHYNSYRQLEEYNLSSQFFNRSDFLKQNADVLVCCNNENISIEELSVWCKYECKTEIVKTTNTGWFDGQFTSLHETFHKFSDYDYVIHSTPDVYIVDDKPIIELLTEELYTENAMILDYHPYHADCNISYCADFIVFKPKLISDFFAIEDAHEKNVQTEKRLFNRVKELNIPHRTICRGFESLCWQVDKYGLIHNHNNNLIRRILETGQVPSREEAFSHNNVHTGNSIT